MKRFTVTFSPIALDDIEQVVVYYEELQNGLGLRFSSQVQFTLRAIKRNPFFASVRYDNIRCAQVKKFPYLLYITILMKLTDLLPSSLFTPLIENLSGNSQARFFIL